MEGWRNIQEEDRGGPDCPRLKCTAWLLRSNFFPNSCAVIPATPLPLLRDIISSTMPFSVWEQWTSFCSLSTLHSLTSGASATLFPLSVTLSLSPLLLTSLPSGWGSQVTSSRKPSILTPIRLEHQHWQQTTSRGTGSGQGLHKHWLSIWIKLNEWKKEDLGNHQGWHASNSPGRTVSGPFLKAFPISHDLYSVSTQNFSLLIHIHFLLFSTKRGVFFWLCHLLKAHGNSFHF